MQNKKLQVWLPLLFSLVMIAGMYFGYELGSRGGGKKFFKGNKRNTVQEALDVIKSHYVDSVDTDSLSMMAIEQIMNELDPHSVYLPPAELSDANEELEGKYSGIGVEFNIFSDTVNVIYVRPQSPAEEAGLKSGDKIIRVNDSLIAGIYQENDGIRNLIKGKSGTKVQLQILREGQLKNVEVKRGNIPVSSIDAAYMIDKVTGYIRLNKFTRNAYREFMEKLDTMKNRGMQKLIFDLRDNSGGYMDQATGIIDEFIQDNKLMVYTEGLHEPKVEYKAKRPGLFEENAHKLVILINDRSASASEVVAGAVQDWCRGKIIGRRSFGKGLVQLQYDLSDGAALRLTVSRYFTPKGRSIQRSYEKGRKFYMDEIHERYEGFDDFREKDSIKYSNGKEYKTDCGKTVYGGGGIMPDITVAIDTARIDANAAKLIVNGTLNNFVYLFYQRNKKTIDSYTTAEQFNSGFQIDENTWSQFSDFSKKDSVDFKSFTVKDKSLLKLRLKAQLARLKWRSTGFYQVLNSEDEIFKKGVDEVNK